MFTLSAIRNRTLAQEAASLQRRQLRAPHPVPSGRSAVALRPVLKPAVTVNHERTNNHVDIIGSNKNRVKFGGYAKEHLFYKDLEVTQPELIVIRKLPTVDNEHATNHVDIGSNKNRVKFGGHAIEHPFDKDLAPTQPKLYVLRKLPTVDNEHATNHVDIGSNKNRIKLGKYVKEHLFDKSQPASQPKVTFSVRMFPKVFVCPGAPRKLKANKDSELTTHEFNKEEEDVVKKLFLDTIQSKECTKSHSVEEVVEFAPAEEAANEVQYEDDGLVPVETSVPQKKGTSLQRETAALACDLGRYWSDISPRRLRKKPDRYVPSI